MTARIIAVDGAVVTVRVSAQLTESDLAAVQREGADLIRQLGRVSVLVLAEDFDGWQRGGKWVDFSFQDAHDRDIERMAIVGDEKWRDSALLFDSQGLRDFPIEFFPRGRLADAREWLLDRSDRRPAG